MNIATHEAARMAAASAAMNANAGEIILAGIALEFLRQRGPSLLAPIQFVRGIDYAEIPPAHVADAAMKGER